MGSHIFLNLNLVLLLWPCFLYHLTIFSLFLAREKCRKQGIVGVYEGTTVWDIQWLETETLMQWALAALSFSTVRLGTINILWIFGPTSAYVNILLVLTISKNCYFLTPLCLRKLWMVPWVINNCKKWFRLFLSSEAAQAAFWQNIVSGAKRYKIEKVLN
jgi:hypothetical protein